MPREYKRTTNRPTWSQEAMDKAIEAVQSNEMGWLLASKTFGVPQATLRRHALGQELPLRKSYSFKYKKSIVAASEGKNLTHFCEENKLNLRMVRKWRSEIEAICEQVDKGNVQMFKRSARRPRKKKSVASERAKSPLSNTTSTTILQKEKRTTKKSDRMEVSTEDSNPDSNDTDHLECSEVKIKVEQEDKHNYGYVLGSSRLNPYENMNVTSTGELDEASSFLPSIKLEPQNHMIDDFNNPLSELITKTENVEIEYIPELKEDNERVESKENMESTVEAPVTESNTPKIPNTHEMIPLKLENNQIDLHQENGRPTIDKSSMLLCDNNSFVTGLLPYLSHMTCKQNTVFRKKVIKFVDYVMGKDEFSSDDDD